MDWETYERYRATVLMVVICVGALLLMVFQRSAVVRHVRSFLVVFSSPTERLLSSVPSETHPSTRPDPPKVSMPDAEPATTIPAWAQHAEQRRALQVLSDENTRLRDLLQLKNRRWPKSVAAHVIGRDPQRWFQELVLDKGREDGVSVDDPVLAFVSGREGLAGRITEVGPRVSKVMLIQDSLSAVAATVLGSTAEDGVVEGANGHELVLKYLDRGSQVKIGDAVVTSGLGHAFPEGVPMGWVQDITLDQRQLFLQARLRPAVPANQLRMVLVLKGPLQGDEAR